jgi:hypothetical protein
MAKTTGLTPWAMAVPPLRWLYAGERKPAASIQQPFKYSRITFHSSLFTQRRGFQVADVFAYGEDYVVFGRVFEAFGEGRAHNYAFGEAC